jgi:hypothetical protein
MPKRKASNIDPAELLARCQARPARYSGAVAEARRRDWLSAVGMNRLEGAPAPMDIDKAIGELWITGRVSLAEYAKLAKVV